MSGHRSAIVVNRTDDRRSRAAPVVWPPAARDSIVVRSPRTQARGLSIARPPARLLGALSAGLALLIGCGPRAAPVQSACAPVQRPAIQGGSHLLGDQEPPVPYNSVPPTSGWHSSGPPPEGFHDAPDPLSEPEQVAVLEAGGIVVTYHELPPGDVEALRRLVTESDGKAVATAYDRLAPGEVAFTAWGVLQRCDGLEPASVTAFVDAYFGTATVSDRRAPHRKDPTQRRVG